MKLKATLFICLIALFVQSAMAIKVSGLYQASVPVKDESSAARNPALKRALNQVLVKLTGDRNIDQNSGITALSERPEQFVQQFRYESFIDDGKQSTRLLVRFDQSVLNQSLRNYGISIWSNERPSILVWLAHDNDGKRRLVGLEESPEYISIMEARAFARGVTLLFPLLDLEDTSSMNPSDIWAGFKEPIIAASDRYQADVILTGRLESLSSSLWEAKWTAYIDGQPIEWENRGELADIVLEEGIDNLTDSLAARYANIGSSRAEQIELNVSGINNIDQYARVLSYLESLQSITSVNVNRVTANEVTFELISHGGQAVIDQAITLGKTLERVSNNDKLIYRLIRR